jgi:flagellar basal-body rod protein FlgC
MNPALSIALSGLDAARRRLDVSASNVANAGTTGALPEVQAVDTPQAYTPLRVTQHSLPSGGVRTDVAAVDPATYPQFSPASPYADGNGQIAAPNVDLVSERLDQIQAIHAYEANAKLIKVARDLEREAIESFGHSPTDIRA